MNLLIKMPFRAHLRASILLLCAGEQYNCQFESYGDLLPHNSLQLFYLSYICKGCLVFYVCNAFRFIKLNQSK